MSPRPPYSPAPAQWQQPPAPYPAQPYQPAPYPQTNYGPAPGYPYGVGPVYAGTPFVYVEHPETKRISERQATAACFALVIVKNLMALVVTYANSRSGIIGVPLIPLMGVVGSVWCLMVMYTDGAVPLWQVGGALAIIGTAYPSFTPFVPIGIIGLLIAGAGVSSLNDYLKLPAVRARAGLPPVEVAQAQRQAQVTAQQLDPRYR